MPRTTTYESIRKQIEKLEREAEILKKKELGGVIERIRAAIEHYGITAEELFARKRSSRDGAPKHSGAAGRVKPASRVRGLPVAPKYRDENGNTWAGRGNRPRWLVEALKSGKKLEDFAI